MTHHRPTECPACGHDRPRRRGPEETLLAKSEREGLDEWVCGLCRYEWSTPSRKARSSTLAI